MKNLIIFFPIDKKVRYPFEFLNSQLEYWQMQMLSRIPQNQVNIFMIRNRENFFWENKFIPQFQLKWNIWSIYKKDTIIYWDLVYGFNMPKDISHTYPCKISEITTDKNIIKKLFPSCTLNSYECKNYKDIKKYFWKIHTQLKVLKPKSQSRWKGIFIIENIPKADEINVDYYPYLVQEFFDTSWWFYQYCNGIYDFRIVILNGVIIWKILRTPVSWSYITNSHRWWKIIDLWDIKLPYKIQKIIDEIEKYCSQYEHRYYSIDMWVWTDGNIKVFELNSAPAFSNQYIAHKIWDYTAKNILQVT